MAGVHIVGWLEKEDPGGSGILERQKERGGWPRRPEFICFSSLPGAEASAEGSVTPETFPGLAQWCVPNPISTVAICLVKHAGPMESEPPGNGNLFSGVFYYMCCF